MSHSAPPTYSSCRLDHHGIVAGICKKLQIASHIDELIYSPDSKHVTYGEAVVAMIINMLGFTSRPLYLTEEFFRNKPRDLINPNIDPSHLNDDCLGRTLDKLFDSGTTEIFSSVATRILNQLDIEVNLAHLDTTSISLTGEYGSQTPIDDESSGERGVIHITRGHSKDHRPDLKQACLLLITEHSHGIPVYMEALDGNQSDVKSFRESLNRFKSQLEGDSCPIMVMDAAFFCEPNIQEHQDVLWVSRVPEKFKALKDVYEMLATHAVDQDDEGTKPSDITWLTYNDLDYTELESQFGGITQRWIVVNSAKKLKRDQAALEKKISSEFKKLSSSLKALCKRDFEHRNDADQEIHALVSQSHYHYFDQIEISPCIKHEKRGRPPAGAKGKEVWKITHIEIQRDEDLINGVSHGLGLFTIATNEMSAEVSAEELIRIYKAQGATVERGFRFLKDPMFFADSIFLKNPERIMALMMVMTLSLMIYAIAERQLREALQTANKTIPSQTGKQTQRPTMRRVFQIFEGVEVLFIDQPAGQQKIVMNLDEIRLKILSFLPEEVKNIYSVT